MFWQHFVQRQSTLILLISAKIMCLIWPRSTFAFPRPHVPLASLSCKWVLYTVNSSSNCPPAFYFHFSKPHCCVTFDYMPVLLLIFCRLVAFHKTSYQMKSAWIILPQFLCLDNCFSNTKEDSRIPVVNWLSFLFCSVSLISFMFQICC